MQEEKSNKTKQDVQAISKSQTRFITLIVAILIVSFSIFMVFLYGAQLYKYKLNEDGIEFLSNSAEPAKLLQSLSIRGTFIIAPEFAERSAEMPFMTSALTTFTSILIANRKQAITLLRIIDASGNLLYCSTNDGNVSIGRNITAEECNAILADNEKIKLLIESPNAGLANTRVILQEDKIIIEPRKLGDIQKASLLVLKVMYANSEDIIRQVNERLERLEQ